jgi:hypothetical protein
MTKSLTVVLEIDMQLIYDVDDRGLRIAEGLFQTYGAPTDPRALGDVLEKILMRLQGAGIPYPKILLLRRKQLRRGEWQPRKRNIPTAQVEPPPGRRTDEEVIREAKATMPAEEFDRWLPRFQELRKQALLLAEEATERVR